MSEPITDEDLKGWRRLVQEATPGPWSPGDGDVTPHGVRTMDLSDPQQIADVIAPLDVGCSNANFIAAARVIVPSLLDEVERLRKLEEIMHRNAPASLDIAYHLGIWRRGTA